MELEDLQLIKEAQKGNMNAFEELLYRYDRQVLNIAASFRNDLDDAKDIYQEVFIRVYKGLKNFQFKSEFSTWLYRIATNVCITHQTKKKRHSHDSLNREIGSDENSATMQEFIESGHRTDDQAVGSDLSGHIEEALNRLPQRQKMAFTLKYYEGYKIREIAEMMNCGDGTVKRYLHTATQKMRENLKDIAD